MTFMSDKPIRLIATDIDGTLLNNRHELSPRNEQALRQAMKQGIQVVLATGKTFYSAQAIVKQLELTTPGVYVQGLVICGPDGEVLHSQTLPAEAAAQLVQLTEAEHIAVVGYDRSRLLMPEYNRFSDILVEFHEPRPEIVGPLSQVVGSVVFNKMIVMADPAEMPGLKVKVAAHIDGLADIVLSSPFLLEIMPKGMSKGVGLAWLLDYLKVSPDEMLALGDADNDIEMLRMAATGVAMGNAMPQVKQAADVIVATNDADGVAEAVERFVLK
jgi:Cof subfamily protein (haloacid dehalogenase superfamily)